MPPWDYSGPVVRTEDVSANVARYWTHAAPGNDRDDFRSEDDPVVIRVDDPQTQLLPVRRWDKARPAFFRQASTRRPTQHFQHPQTGVHAIVPTGALPAPLQAQMVWGITRRTVRSIPGAWDSGTELQ